MTTRASPQLLLPLFFGPTRAMSVIRGTNATKSIAARKLQRMEIGGEDEGGSQLGGGTLFRKHCRVAARRGGGEERFEQQVTSATFH